MRLTRSEHGGWVHAVFLVSLIIGTVTTTPNATPEAEQKQRQSCSPIEWDDDAGPEWEQGWNQLMAIGWIGRAGDGMDAIYPPGCESVR